MSARTIVVAAVALISAIGTTVMVRNWVAAERAAAAATPKASLPASPPMSEVLVATEALPAGLLLKPQHLKWQTWPNESVRDGYFAKDKVDMQAVIGSVVRSGIGPGEPILESRIVRPGERGFLAAILTPGMRAVSVPVNATSGIAGLVFPGDRVDVILTHTLNGDNAQQQQQERVRRASETVLEDIRVLAMDQRIEQEDGGAASVAKTATLEVTPKQAEILSMVTELGRLSLSLRSLQATTPAAAAEAATQAVTEGDARRASSPRQSYTLDSNVSVLLDPPAIHGRGKQGRQVEVIRGKDAKQITF